MYSILVIDTKCILISTDQYRVKDKHTFGENMSRLRLMTILTDYLGPVKVPAPRKIKIINKGKTKIPTYF